MRYKEQKILGYQEKFDRTLKKDEAETSETLALAKEKPTVHKPRLWQKGEIIEGLYEVRDMNTSGGMGVVYFVNHINWNTMLAVKSPNPRMLGDEENVRRFIREAETWVDLGKHPNIAICFYVRIIEGIPRIFVEYVEGGSLKEWMEKGRAAKLEDVLDIAIQISEGMAHAHSQKNLIHRDLKPANVLMTKDGVAKITDFGLVRRGSEVEKPSGSISALVQDVWKSMTMGGARMGTPAYMPPEQWDAAHKAGREADVYAFGVILYEMLCGRRPFELTQQEKEMHPMAQAALFERKHKEEKVPALTREVPASLSSLVMKCLEKFPDNRYHSFEELREQLKSIYQEAVGREYPRKLASEVKLKADDLNNRALSLLDLKQEDKAVKCWEEALQLNPHHMESVFNHGYWQWHNGIITDEHNLDRIRELQDSESSNPVYWHSLGLIHLERGDLEESITATKKALELGFRDAGVFNALGLAYMGLEELENAKNAFKQAISSQDNWQSRLYLAEVLFKSGEEQTCREEIRTLLRNSQYRNALEIQGIADEIKALQYTKTHKVRRIRLIKILKHTDDVNSVAFSPDGMHILTGSRDKSARIWDIKTGESIRTLTGHTYPVESVAFSPDGRYVLTGSVDGTARIWDVKTGENIKTLKHPDSVDSVAFSPDGRYILTGSRDNTARIWDIKTGESIRILTGHTFIVESVTFSPDGRYALTGSMDGTARIWDIKMGKNIRTLTLKGHILDGHPVAFSPDGMHILTGSGDKTARIWDIKTGDSIKTLTEHTGSVSSVAFSPDGRYILTGSSDYTVQIWDIKAGKCIRILTHHTYQVRSVAFSPDGRHVLTGSRDKTAQIWEVINSSDAYFHFIICKPIDALQSDLEEEAAELIKKASTLIKMNLFSGAYKILRQIQTIRGFERALEALELLSLCGKKGKRVKLKDAWQKKIIQGHTDHVNSVAFSPDGMLILTGSDDNTARLWDLKTGENIRTLKHTKSVDSVTFSPDGRYALTGSHDETARIWDIKTGDSIKTLTGHTGSVSSVAFSPDGRYILTGSSDYTARLWDLKTGENIKTLIGHKGMVRSVAFSPDGRYVLTGGYYTARLWDVKTGENIRTLQHAQWVSSVAFSPDCRYVLTGSEDNTLGEDNIIGYYTAQLWDVKTSKNIKTLKHPHSVDSVAFSPDGRYVLTGSSNIAQLWDMTNGENIRTLKGHIYPVNSVTFSSDCRFALTGGNDNTALLWEFDWELEFPEEKKEPDELIKSLSSEVSDAKTIQLPTLKEGENKEPEKPRIDFSDATTIKIPGKSQPEPSSSNSILKKISNLFKK